MRKSLLLRSVWQLHASIFIVPQIDRGIVPCSSKVLRDSENSSNN